ncbi:MAG: IS200/IS605 family element transposase accessory protein TnpB [Caldilineaceae bacterium SB0661_bin_34]|nr:IS200/IS605 family element transposase accessory protein TnpB [Caldilineaceae bacterium SB0661_bin_34]
MKTAKVTRILHSQGLHKAKFDRLARIAALCGRVRTDAWQRCSGLSTAQQSAYEIRNTWMAEGYDWHGLPARLGKATLADALGDIRASREAAKVSVKKAIWHRTRGDGAERHRLYALLKRNRWDEDSFLHRQMRKKWKGGTSHCTNQIVADAGSYTTKVWHGRAWVYLQGLERGQRLAIPLRGTHLPTGTLRIILQDNGQVAIHYAIDEDTACSTKSCGTDTIGVDKGYTEAYADSEGERHGEGLGDLLVAESDARRAKGGCRNQLRAVEQKHREAGRIKKADNIRRNNLGNQKWDRRQKKHTAQTRDFLCHAAHRVVDRAGTIACEDLTAPMSSSKYRHRDTNRRLSGWVKGVMADTLTSISRRRGTALVLVNPAYTSQIDSRTGLLQGTRRGDRFYGLDGVVLDADTNAARNILQRMYDDEITLYMPFREVKRLLLDRSGTTDGTAHPGLEPARQLALP